jgi:hypothetical protein
MDDLLKRLRAKAQQHQILDDDPELAELLNEAADRIESDNDYILNLGEYNDD